MEPISQSSLCQVPSKIYAVNYTHKGSEISYSVNDSSKAKYHRSTEPRKTVQIVGTDGHSQTLSQAVKLSTKGWTSYTVNATKAFKGSVAVKMKAEIPNSEICISINKKASSLILADTIWTIVIEDHKFTKGEYN